MSPADRDKKIGCLCIAVAAILFSTMEIALKFTAGAFHPLQMTFVRFLIGGTFLLPFALKEMHRTGNRPDLKSILYFALLGLLCVVVSMSLFQLSVAALNASVVAVLFSSNPVFVLFFAFLILREKIRPSNVIALIFEIIGIVLIIDPLHINMSVSGVVLALSSTLLFSFYSVLGKRKCNRYGSLVVTSFTFLLGGLEMALLAALTNVGPVAGLLTGMGLPILANIPLLQGFSLLTLPAVLYVSIGPTGIGYVTYFKAMEKTSANTASLTFFFKPILAPILAFLILREAIPLNMIVGIGMILIGSLIPIIRGLARPRIAEGPVRRELPENI